ncbi:DUF4232 domain-containing protein [Saccharopolyspora pogona]|uniref:DUF4232 domain-containing protein n=1 Tax=Saccharopolyspora pogona TaxID=333966 RepID=UPI001683EAE3|nr:DUF4232 domain-containing protein [Saccharopolyspora pogona]
MFKNSRGIRVGMFVAGVAVLAATTACSPQQSAATSGAQPGSSTAIEANSTPGSNSSGNGESTNGSESAATSGSAGTSRVGECKVNTLKLTLGESDGAAGHIYAPIQFTNTGSAACTLSSAPGVSYVGTGGRQIGEPAERVINNRPVISLAPGETASAPFLFSPGAQVNPEDCGAEAADGLRVYPPNSTEAMFLPLPNVKSCTTFGSESNFAKVGVVQAGVNNTVIG